MKRILSVLLALLVMSGTIVASEEYTQLEQHIKSTTDKVNNGEALFTKDFYPGTFDVTYVGIDPSTNGPVFHVKFISNTFYSSGRDYVSRFDVTSYVDGMVTFYNITEDHSKVSSERTDQNNNKWQTLSLDYYAVFYNPEDQALDQTYSFALTRNNQDGNIIIAMNVIDIEVVYDPNDVEPEPNENDAFTVDDMTSEDDIRQNTRNTTIYKLVGSFVAVGGGLILLRRRKKVKLKRKKPVKKIIEKPAKKPGIIKNIASVFKKTSELAVKGLKKVSTTLVDGYTKITSIGINTRFGRVEVGDLLGLTGANKVANVVTTISDLCDVINKNKDISKVWSNFVDRTVNSKMGKLRKWFGKGLKINPKVLKKLINISKELRTVAGIMKDGISADELLNIKKKLASYKQGTTHVEKYNKVLERQYTRVEKGLKIEGKNFKRALKGKG